MGNHRNFLAKEVVMGAHNIPFCRYIRKYPYLCSTIINLILLKIANSFLLNIGKHEIFSANNKYENTNCFWHFHVYQQRKFHADLS